MTHSIRKKIIYQLALVAINKKMIIAKPVLGMFFDLVYFFFFFRFGSQIFRVYIYIPCIYLTMLPFLVPAK